MRSLIELHLFFFDHRNAVREQLIGLFRNDGLFADGRAPVFGRIERRKEGARNGVHLFKFGVVNDVAALRRRLAPLAVFVVIMLRDGVRVDVFPREVFLVCRFVVRNGKPRNMRCVHRILIHGDNHARCNVMRRQIAFRARFVNLLAVNKLCVLGITEREVLIVDTVYRKLISRRIAGMNKLVTPTVRRIRISVCSASAHGVRLFRVRVEYDKRIIRIPKTGIAVKRSEPEVRRYEICACAVIGPAVSERIVFDLKLIFHPRRFHLGK